MSNINDAQVSIVIVTFFSKDTIGECLASIWYNCTSDYQIIIFDNASQDETVEFLRSFLPKIHLVSSKNNMGFAYGVNRGIELAQDSKYILLLNPDAAVTPAAIETLAKFMEENPSVGVCGGKVLYENGQFQPACRRGLPTPWVAFCKIFGLSALFPKSRLFARYNLTFLPVDATTEVDAVSGSFMMLRKQALDEVGNMDTAFFLYAEDIDLCYRMQKKGWKVFYVPTASIIHKKGHSAKKAPVRARYEFYNTMWLFHKKHFKKKTFFIINWLIYILVSIFKAKIVIFNYHLRYYHDLLIYKLAEAIERRIKKDQQNISG